MLGASSWILSKAPHLSVEMCQDAPSAVCRHLAVSRSAADLEGGLWWCYLAGDCAKHEDFLPALHLGTLFYSTSE